MACQFESGCFLRGRMMLIILARQERIKQRLRGVLRREISDVDFGLVFPSAPRSKTPDLAAIPQTSLIQGDFNKDPLNLPEEKYLNRTPLTSNLNTLKGSGHLSPKNTRSTNANTSKKRKKLQDNESPIISSQITRSSQEKSVSQRFQILEDNAGLEAVSADASKNSDKVVIHREDNLESNTSHYRYIKLRKTPKSRRTPEVNETSVDTSCSSQPVQVVPTLHISEQKIVQSITKEQKSDQTSLGTQKQRKSRAENIFENSFSSQDQFSHVGGLQVNDSDEVDELSPDRVFSKAHNLKYQISNVEISVGQEEHKEAEFFEDNNADQILAEYQKQRNDISRIQSPDLDEPVPNLPTKKRQRTNRGSNSNSNHVGELFSKSKAKAVRNKGSLHAQAREIIPITIQRLSTPIVHDDRFDDGDEILNMEMPRIKRRDVNYIDVLMKIFQDMIESKLLALKSQAENCRDTAKKREIKTQWQAMNAFGTELQDRLLEHRRLRNEHKKKIELRKEILKVRAEREQVALKIDEIRKNHQISQEKYMKKSILNDAIHNLELAMDIERNSGREFRSPSQAASHNFFDSVGTQVLLKKVAHQVSNQSGTGGLLRQVKDFNSFLERSALALERKMT